MELPGLPGKVWGFPVQMKRLLTRDVTKRIQFRIRELGEDTLPPREPQDLRAQSLSSCLRLCQTDARCDPRAWWRDRIKVRTWNFTGRADYDSWRPRSKSKCGSVITLWVLYPEEALKPFCRIVMREQKGERKRQKGRKREAAISLSPVKHLYSHHSAPCRPCLERQRGPSSPSVPPSYAVFFFLECPARSSPLSSNNSELLDLTALILSDMTPKQGKSVSREK